MRKAYVRREPFGLGVFGVVVVLIGCYLIFTKHIPFTHGYRVHAVFQSNNQLKKGSPVRIAGITVGKVSKIERGPGTYADVTLDLQKQGLPLHTDTTARIRPRLFLEGGFFVQLEPGSPSAPTLKENGTIPLSQTSTPVQFHQILGALNRPTRDSLRTILDELAVALDKGGAEAIGTSGKPLSALLKDVAIISKASRGSEIHDVSELVTSSALVTKAVASRDNHLADLVTGLNVTTGALAAEDAALAATLRGLDATLHEAPDALAALNASLPAVNSFTRALRPTLQISPPILTKASAVLTQAYALAGPKELPALVTALAPGVRALPTLVTRLTELFPLVTPVTDCVRDKALPVLTAKLDDGNLSSGRPVWQDLAHAMVGLASASQNFDGNGPAVRYLAGTGENAFSTGTLPGPETLFGSVGQPIIGSRPLWLGPNVKPPFRPDAPCHDQTAPDLKARTNLFAREHFKRGGAGRSRLTVKGLVKTIEKAQRKVVAKGSAG